MVSLLQQWLTKQAEQRAEAVALVLQKERVTYGELEEDSKRLAHLLQAAGCRRDDRVCFLMPKAPAAILSQLAILKADCIRAGVGLIQRLLDTDPARLPLTPQDLTLREYFGKQTPVDGCVHWERPARNLQPRAGLRLLPVFFTLEQSACDFERPGEQAH